MAGIIPKAKGIYLPKETPEFMTEKLQITGKKQTYKSKANKQTPKGNSTILTMTATSPSIASRAPQLKDLQLTVFFQAKVKPSDTQRKDPTQELCQHISRVSCLIQLAGGKTHLSKLGKLVLWEENVGLNIDTKCYNQNGI